MVMYKVFTAKVFLRSFSSVTLLTGLCALLIPIWTLVRLLPIREHIGLYSWFVPTVALMTIGLIMVFNSILGACSELKTNIWLLIIFLKVLIYCGILAILVGLSIIYFLVTVDDNVKTGMTKIYFPEYNNKTADDLHRNMECCGYNNYTDFNVYFGYPKEEAPITCCTSAALVTYGRRKNNAIVANTMCVNAKIEKDYMEDDGCYTVVKDKGFKHGSLILILAIGLGLFWLISVVILVYNIMFKDDPIYLVEMED